MSHEKCTKSLCAISQCASVNSRITVALHSMSGKAGEVGTRGSQ